MKSRTLPAAIYRLDLRPDGIGLALHRLGRRKGGHGEIGRRPRRVADARRQSNAGPASARNTGARLASGEILVYTDADCVPKPDWLSQLVAGFGEGIVAVGGTYAIANPSSRLARVVQLAVAAHLAGAHVGVTC